MRVHRALGPGFLESVYKNALGYELQCLDLEYAKEIGIDVTYRGVAVGHFVADMLVENSLILELKAVRDLTQAHEVQLVNYLAATGIDSGLLLNFGRESLQCKRKYRLFHNPVNPVNPV